MCNAALGPALAAALPPTHERTTHGYPRPRRSRRNRSAVRCRRRDAHAHHLRRDDRPRRPRARLLPPAHPRPRHPARQAHLRVRARPPRGTHDRRARHRLGARPLALRARARARLHHHRPPAVPLVHPDGADEGRDRVRPRRLGERPLRRLLARGSRRGPRRERGARLARRRVRAPRHRGRRVRAGRHPRQPLGARRRSRAGALRCSERPARRHRPAGRSCAAPRRTRPSRRPRA